MDAVGSVVSNLVHDFARLFAGIMGRPRRKNHSRRRFCCSAVVLYKDGKHSTGEVEKKFGTPMHVYEVRPRKDHRGVDLISDALPFGRLWYGEPNAVANSIGYAKHRSRSH